LWWDGGLLAFLMGIVTFSLPLLIHHHDLQYADPKVILQIHFTNNFAMVMMVVMETATAMGTEKLTAMALVMATAMATPTG
jgi:hypothetical protein